ncbi:hypothetical protein [Acidisphaera sp. S103]|uniref:hypothetical protein n=1 Tax=Acidisphaera sp. S103 TaxID=1747223 RepID=UPI00131EBFC5|nr:hypothetical protein [Acidisphaera sp. S103]
MTKAECKNVFRKTVSGVPMADMNMSDDQKWHWGEGTKYVLEGGKSIFLINGASAISVLTFIGNTKIHQIFVTISIGLFAFGALASAMIFLFCYLTQLEYGNVGIGRYNRWHKYSYWSVGTGVMFFFLGMVIAMIGFLRLP